MKRSIKYKIVLPLATLMLFAVACSKSFLEVTPPGTLNESVVANKAGVEALLIGAYSLLDGEGGAGTNNGPWATAASNWVYGSVAGGDAHKGSDPGDQNLIIPIETWNVNASNDFLDQVWQSRYDGVQRSNEALRLLAKATDLSAADVTEVTSEVRFLRGHYHFELRKMFGKVPYIDETITYSQGNFLVPNTDDILPKIEADFMDAYTNLPETQKELGRANKWAAASYLAKTYIFEKKYAEAKALLTTIIANGKTSKGDKYALTDNFADNFNPAKKNSSNVCK
jgi:starch-binding outer membrane protein, SusD/RagB family